MAKNGLVRALLVSAALLGSATPAEAAEVLFSGSMSGTATGVLAPSCAPLPRQSNLTGSGSSSLGSFNYSHQVCLAGVGPINGNFSLDFSGGNTLFGTINGSAVANPTPGLFDIVLAYNILGGTGSLFNSSGTFLGTGLVDQTNLPTTRVSINFSPVPEPATWAMMLLGFTGMGMAYRRTKTPRVVKLQ